MPLTGGRIVHSLNQAQGVILETLKEREKDRAEERKEELSAGGLALPSKVSLASLLAHSLGRGASHHCLEDCRQGKGAPPSYPLPPSKCKRSRDPT